MADINEDLTHEYIVKMQAEIDELKAAYHELSAVREQDITEAREAALERNIIHSDTAREMGRAMGVASRDYVRTHMETARTAAQVEADMPIWREARSQVDAYREFLARAGLEEAKEENEGWDK